MVQNKQDEIIEEFHEIPIPVDIVSHVSKLVTRMRSNKKESKQVNYTPTNLAFCVRLQYYALQMYPKERLDSDDEFSSGWNLFRGSAIHYSLGRIFKGWNELPLKIDFPISDTKSVIISGRLDCYKVEGGEILDLKTTRYLKWQKSQKFVPRQKDINQLRIYSVLYRDILPIKKLSLLYADMADLVAFDIPILQETESWLRNRILEIEDGRKAKVPPTGEVSALCAFCPYQTRCYSDGKGITTNPKSHPVEVDLN